LDVVLRNCSSSSTIRIFIFSVIIPAPSPHVLTSKDLKFHVKFSPHPVLPLEGEVYPPSAAPEATRGWEGVKRQIMWQGFIETIQEITLGPFKEI
jgi:hypothetical protein